LSLLAETANLIAGLYEMFDDSVAAQVYRTDGVTPVEAMRSPVAGSETLDPGPAVVTQEQPTSQTISDGDLLSCRDLASPLSSISETVDSAIDLTTAPSSLLPPVSAVNFERFVKEGNLDEVKENIARGINIEQRNEDGMTPLLVAAQHNRIEILKALIEKKADLSVTDEEQRTVLHCALGIPDGYDLVQVILRYGVNVNAEDDEGKTPLHYAVRCRNHRVAKALLKRKADVNATDKNLLSVLQSAINTKNDSMVKMLLDKHADTASAKFEKSSAAIEYVFKEYLKGKNMRQDPYERIRSDDCNEQYVEPLNSAL